VFEQEPPSPDNPLFSLENVVLTPHIAGLSEEAKMRMAVEIANEILRVLRGEKPTHYVNPEVYLKEKVI